MDVNQKIAQQLGELIIRIHVLEAQNQSLMAELSQYKVAEAKEGKDGGPVQTG